MNATNVQEGFAVNARSAELVNRDGERVGTVDHMDGDYIKLKRSDSEDGEHHWIPLDWVSEVRDNTVFLDKTYDEFYLQRMDELPNAAKSA